MLLVASSEFAKVIVIGPLLNVQRDNRNPGLFLSSCRTQTNLLCFCRKGDKWVRLFWHFRHEGLVLLQALVSMEMKNSVCHACSWIEFQTLG